MMMMIMKRRRKRMKREYVEPVCAPFRWREKNLCARDCGGRDKKGYWRRDRYRRGAGRTGRTKQEAKEEKVKRGKKVGSLKN